MATVLLIDDDERVLETLRDLVLTLGYEVSTARSGVGGLAAVKADPPDAVLLDVTMPGMMDGLETLQAIRAHRPDLPVIMVTANIDAAIAKATLRAGAFDYVLKPVEVTRLADLLAAAVTLSRTPPTS